MVLLCLVSSLIIIIIIIIFRYPSFLQHPLIIFFHPPPFPVLLTVTHWGRECTCHYDPSICVAPPGMHHNFYYVRVGHNLEMSGKRHPTMRMVCSFQPTRNQFPLSPPHAELNACFGRFQLQDWSGATVLGPPRLCVRFILNLLLPSPQPWSPPHRY